MSDPPPSQKFTSLLLILHCVLDHEPEEDPNEHLSTAQQFAAFIRRELPRLVRRELESSFEGQLEETLRNRIIERLGGIPTELYRQFQHHVEFVPQGPEMPVDSFPDTAVGELAGDLDIDFDQWLTMDDFFDVLRMPQAPEFS